MMKPRGPFRTAFLWLGVLACAHSPGPGRAIYSARAEGTVESLQCIARSLQVAGYVVEERVEGELYAERPGSPANDGGLSATWVVRGSVGDSGDRTQLLVEVTLREEARPEPEETTRPPSMKPETRAPRRPTMGQARIAADAEFDPIIARCRLDRAPR